MSRWRLTDGRQQCAADRPELRSRLPPRPGSRRRGGRGACGRGAGAPFAPSPRSRAELKGGPARIVIVGGGAAGFAAAEMLRRRAPSFDRLDVDGSIAARDATIRFMRDGKVLAAVFIGRDQENVAIQAEMEAVVSTQSREPLPV